MTNRPKTPLRLIKADLEAPVAKQGQQGDGVCSDGSATATRSEQRVLKTRQKPLIQFLNQFCDSIDQEIATILDL